MVQNGQEDVFVIGTDGRLYENFEALSSSQWSGWTNINPASVFIAAPVAISRGPGLVDVFATASNRSVWEISYSGGWSNWVSLGGVVGAGGPGGVAQGNQEDIFVTGTDGHLYENLWTGHWSGWFIVNSQGTLISGLVAVSRGTGLVDVFAVGTDSAKYWISYARSWSGWQSLGGSVTAGSPGAVVQSGQDDVFVVGQGGALFEDFLVPSTGWSGWFQVNNQQLLAGPGVASPFDGYVDIFSVRTDNSIWQTEYSPAYNRLTAAQYADYLA